MDICIILQSSPKIQVKGEFDMADKKQENVQIGLRVKQAREAAGLTQERLAELVDVTAQFLSGVERGTVGLSVPALSRLCSVLLVSSDFILTGGTETADVTSITARLSRLPPEHIENVEEILYRYIEGLSIERNSKSGE